MKVIIPLLCFPLFLHAYTLKELVEISQKNRVVAAADFALKAKEKLYESTKSSYLPVVNVAGSYANNLEETPATARNTLRASASLQYTLYDGGKRGALYDKLLYSVDAGKMNVEAVKNTIALDVTRLYFDYLSSRAHQEAIQQQITQLQAELQRLQMYYETGSVTRDEVDKIDSRVKMEQTLLNEIEFDIQRTLHTLEYYTTTKIDTIEAGSYVNFEEEQTLQVRPDIKAMELQTQALMYDAQTLKSNNLPTLYFDNTYTYAQNYFEDSSKDRGFLLENQNVASLNVKWNVFDFGAISEAYEAKQYEYLSAKSLVDFEMNKADVELRLSKKELELTKVKIEATKAALDAATATFELIKLKYQNGAIDNIAYLQSLSEKYGAQRVYEKAKNDLEIKKAELLFNSGRTIKEYFR